MSVEGNIARAAALALIGLGVGLARSKIQSSNPLSPADIERTRVAPLTIPGAFDRSMAATQEAFSEQGYPSLIEKGFPEIAVTSAVNVYIQYENAPYSLHGSGNLMHIDGYWVVLTAAHVIDFENKNFDPDIVSLIRISGDKSLPDWTDTFLSHSEFGIATSRDKNVDFGVLVIPDENVPATENEIYKNIVLTRDQIYDWQGPLESNYYTLCFPGKERNPTIVFDGELADYMGKPVTPSWISIKGAILQNGCSGVGFL